MSFKSYKGTDKNMQCRGFQYEIGKEYEADKAECFDQGFHACEYPLDVFGYYPPGLGSRYFEVEQSGDIDKGTDDTKAASTKLKVCAEIGIPDLVKAAIEYTTSRAKPVKGGHSAGFRGAASATGDRGAASATGLQGAASATGGQGAASATGKACVALSAGEGGRAKGSIGSAICMVERGEWNGELYPIVAVKAAIVDGKTIKADVWYMLKDGEFVECEDEQ